MKFQKTLTILFIGLVLCCSSCKKNIFDFDVQNIDVEGEWGLPVFNDNISIGDLLQKLDSTSTIQAGEDGTLVFTVEKEVRDLVSLSNIFNIGDKQFDTVGVADITHLPNFEITKVIEFSLNSEDFAMTFASIKSGTLTLNFNISPTYFTYTAQLTSDNITNAQGQPMTINLSNLQHQKTIDLSNYIVQPFPNGKILISATMVVPTSLDIPQLNYDCHVTLHNFQIGSIVGKSKTLEYHLEDAAAFTFPTEHLQLDGVNLNNAKILLSCQNSICDINGTVNSLYLHGNNGAYTPFITSPTDFSIPVSPIQYIPVKEIQVPSIQYNQTLDSLKFNCDFRVNPLGFNAGDIALDNHSALHLKLKALLPANISIDNAVYKDTVDNALQNQLNPSIIQSIENLTLRIAFTNALPFDLVPKISFLNSSTGEVYDLKLNGLQLHGSYNGIPNQQEPTYIEVNQKDASRIINADKIIMNFRLGTQGYTVEIKDSQFIKVAIGAKVKYSNISMQ